MRAARQVCLALLLTALAISALPADELTTIVGKKTSGKLLTVNAEGVTFQTGDADVKVAAKDILLVDLGNKIQPIPKETKFDEIELTDGSVLRVTKFLIKGKAFTTTPLSNPGPVATPSVEMPLNTVFTVLRGADDPKNREDWKKMLVNRGKRDLYVIRQSEGLNFLPGTILEGNETGDAVTFEKEDGQRTPLRLIRASGGLVFNQPPQGTLPPTLCKVLDVFGNVLYATAIQIEGSAVKVKTVSGATFTYPSTQSIAKLDYGQGNIAYLSDLDPQVQAPEADPFEPKFTWNKDKNQLNEPLRLEGQSFVKGLWVFADTTLTFPIGGDYREFKAMVGTDDTITNGTTVVKLTIEADGRTLFNDSIKRTDKPKPLNLDVKGVKQLKISVAADTPYNGNQIILGDARVQK